MTAQAKVENATTAPRSMKGERKTGFSSSHAAGIIGGVLGAAACYGEGASLGAAVVGGVVGGISGWAAGNCFAPLDDVNATTRIIGGGTAALLGACMGSVGASLTDSIMKIGNSRGE